jgi:hypothetical protein
MRLRIFPTMRFPTMQRLSISSLVLVLAASIPAQAPKTVTSPPGYETLPGGAHSEWMGGLTVGVVQLIDGETKGKMAIREIAFRLDPGRDYNKVAVTNLGRSWTLVTLDVCELATTAGPGTTFSKNCGTTPTTVFSSTMKWASVKGLAVTAPWGGSGTRFPFGSPWTYTGSQRLVSTYRFRGGTFTNGRPWGVNQHFGYYLDAAFGQTRRICARGATIARLNCADSAFGTSAVAAATELSWCNHDDTWPTPSLRGKTFAYSSSNWTAPQAQVIHAWGTPEPTPLNVGAQCNRLYIRPLVYFFRTASTQANWANATAVLPVFKMIPSTFGVGTAVQGAWTDSKTGFFSLTNANITRLPGLPGALKQWMYYGKGLTTVGTPRGAGPMPRYLYD